MTKAILTVGASGSGKSFWAKRFVSENPGWVIVCRDDIRAMQGFPPLGDQAQEKVVTTVQRGFIEAAVLDGFNIIVADTNLNKDVRNGMVHYLHKHQVDVEFQIFDTPLDVCIERDKARVATVGEKVIRKQYDRYRNLPDLPPQPVEKFGTIESKSSFKKEDILIVDIDGTVARHVARSPYEYDKVNTDEPITSVVSLVQALNHYSEDWDWGRPVFVSGRPDSCRKETEAWLTEHIGISEPELYMRKVGDERQDWIIKSEIYDRDILPKYNVIMAFDDRDQVVRHLRNRGVTVAQVAPGRF